MHTSQGRYASGHAAASSIESMPFSDHPQDRRDPTTNLRLSRHWLRGSCSTRDVQSMKQFPSAHARWMSCANAVRHFRAIRAERSSMLVSGCVLCVVVVKERGGGR